MRAIVILAGAIAFAAYIYCTDPFGSPDPELCPGGVCPSPRSVDDESRYHAEVIRILPTQEMPIARKVLVDPSVPNLLPEVKPEPQPAKMPTTLVSIEKPRIEPTKPPLSQPVLRREPAPLRTGEDGWQIRLFYPPSAEKLAGEINAGIEAYYPLAKFCERYGYSKVPTDDPAFKRWQDYGHQPDIITFTLISPSNKCVYLTHRVPKSGAELLSLLQEIMDGGCACSPVKSNPFSWNDSPSPLGRLRRW